MATNSARLCEPAPHTSLLSSRQRALRDHFLADVSCPETKSLRESHSRSASRNAVTIAFAAVPVFAEVGGDVVDAYPL